MIFVSHDRYLLSTIAGRLIELKDGEYRLHEYGFDKYLDVLRDEQAAEKRAAELEKQQKAAQAAKDKSAKVYKTKQQRSAEAARKNEIRRIENEIEAMQQQIDALTEEISHEDVYSDYELMNKKCAEIDELKNKIDEYFDILVELDA